MLDGEKILVTGVTGKIAFPIARALAEGNEVWGAARLRNPQDSDNLVAAGITPLPLDMSTGDFSDLPERLHLRLPRRGGPRRRRLAALPHDERA